MILIGERINGMFTDVKRAIADRNKQVIQDLAARQVKAGATYLDVNVGTASADQEGTMQWLVETIQETCSAGLSLDSQKPNVIAAGLKVINPDNGVLLNSSPLNKKSDEDILDKYIEMAEATGPKTSLIALTMDKNGVPQDMDMRVAIAAEIVQKAMEKGFDTQRLFIDPIILPVKVPNAQIQPKNILGAMEQIQYLADPAPHMTIGLSNLSQGTEERSLINRTFLAMAVSHGLDSAIVDVLDDNLMKILATSEMLMNKQIYSDSFLKIYAPGADEACPPVQHAPVPYTVGQIAESMDYPVICGDDALSNTIERVVIAATEHESMLRHIKRNTLVVVPRSQINTILGVIAIAKSDVHSFGCGNGGLILTGKSKSDPILYFLMSDANIPVLITDEDVFMVNARIRHLMADETADENETAGEKILS